MRIEREQCSADAGRGIRSMNRKNGDCDDTQPREGLRLHLVDNPRARRRPRRSLFDAGATVDVGDLSFGRNVAIARSGSVDWIDGFAGARMRIGLAPGRRSEAAS
ncbi:hypothetical protein FQV39_14975 [Bosea sp. F3-2]|uniref:hypothetical protein n=1 Tax=Bosea sp. F3-2 TaxID=2599640 RepID=UPI0011ECC4EC|nr:hypothetical protein [Bosea sp. F3-2]QEL23740.1 hypothetical protein FQV39_14975 [Bosea sp. F3-2]